MFQLSFLWNTCRIHASPYNRSYQEQRNSNSFLQSGCDNGIRILLFFRASVQRAQAMLLSQLQSLFAADRGDFSFTYYDISAKHFSVMFLQRDPCILCAMCMRRFRGFLVNFYPFWALMQEGVFILNVLRDLFWFRILLFVLQLSSLF